MSHTEKWAVVVPISEHMHRLFTYEEIETFARVLAIYTIPEGIPQDEPSVTRTTDMMRDIEFMRAWVRVEGVLDTDKGFDAGRLYEGATMTPDEDWRVVLTIRDPSEGIIRVHEKFLRDSYLGPGEPDLPGSPGVTVEVIPGTSSGTPG
jgi:hypothetical protein